MYYVHLCALSLQYCRVVVNAAHTFYNGTTTLPISEEDRTPRKRISKTLNMTTNPEEKRKIIGDTFVKVSMRLLFCINSLFTVYCKIMCHLSCAGGK